MGSSLSAVPLSRVVAVAVVVGGGLVRLAVADGDGDGRAARGGEAARGPGGWEGGELRPARRVL